jgi:hypothetical protein
MSDWRFAIDDRKARVVSQATNNHRRIDALDIQVTSSISVSVP